MAVSNIDEGDRRDELVELIMGKWMHRDSIAASEWVSNISNKRDRDSTIGVMVVEIMAKDHDIPLAEQWLKQVSDPSSRKILMEKIYPEKP